jgi:hypothetical protein
MVRRPKWERTWWTDQQDQIAKEKKAAEPKKPPGNPNWLAGQSGNPGGVKTPSWVKKKPTGRPKAEFELARIAREGAPEYLACLRGYIRSKKTPPGIVVRCIEILLDRGFGKPQQTVALEQKDIAVMSDEELYAAIRMG